MFVARLIRLSLLAWLVLLFACGTTTPAPITPVPAAVALNPTTVAADIATDVSGSPTVIPTNPPPTAPSTNPPALQITIITPTPIPTLPPVPTAAAVPTGVFSSTTSGGTTTVTGPSEIGNTAADAALVSVLRRCWNVTDTRQLNGSNPAHRTAFDCARQSLLDLASRFPAYGLVQRVLAWGYFYRDNSTGKAITAYQTAANIYQKQNDKSGESEARMRLALLLTSSNLKQACAQLSSAANLDPSNQRAADYYSAFNCGNASAQAGGNAPPPPAPVVDLTTLRGKILFKSDRDGFPSAYMMDADGKNPQRISTATYNAAAQWESWSPDRSEAATVRFAGYTRKSGYDNDIWITDPQGNGRPLTNPADDYDPAWSQIPLFDGQTWIVFVSTRGDLLHSDHPGEDLWVMHHDGKSPFRITCNGPYYSKHPSWSPDAKQITFYSNQQGARAQIYTMDVSAFGTLQDNCAMGKNPVNLSQNNYNDSDPIWVK